MRYTLLFTLLFLYSAGLYAQYGTTYQFHFTIQDSETGFDSASSLPKIKVRKRGQMLVMKANHYTYQIHSAYQHSLSAENGTVTLNYGAIPPYVSFKLSISRRHKRKKDWLKLHLIYPEDKDFAQLQWRKDSLHIDLSFNQEPFDYQLITPKTENGNRDLSCLINGHCEPQWELSERGLYKQEQARIKKFRRIKWKIDYRTDSLIAAHFPNGIFDQFFEEECVTAHYSGDTTYTALHCEIPVDTNLYSLTRQYTLKSPAAGVDLSLSIYGFIDQAPYFLNTHFGNKRFTASELNILSPAEILSFAQKEYPEIDFAEDASGAPYIGLVYLSELPQNYYERPEGPEPLIPSSIERQKTPSWFGTFAYLMQNTLPEQGKWNGVANYYFYAHKARLIVRTENYYDLTNE